jgi:uncharacterized membrane protein
MKNKNELQSVAKALGWFSVGLGLAEFLAPRQLEKIIGVKNRRGTLRLFGLRELTSGIGILTQEERSKWMWSRVAGDALDLAALGAAMGSGKNSRAKLIAATGAVLGVTALDVICSQELSRRRSQNGEDTTEEKPRAFHVVKTIGIMRPAADLYGFWRNFENLPRFMAHLKSVRVIDEKRSHWVAQGPLGKNVEWDAEIIEDKPNELIAWRTIPGSDVQSSGSVRFTAAPGRRGSLVRVEMEYLPPGGALGLLFAKLFGKSPEQQVWQDLHHFEMIMEAGEVSTIRGQSAGRAKSTSKIFDYPTPAGAAV